MRQSLEAIQNVLFRKNVSIFNYFLTTIGSLNLHSLNNRLQKINNYGQTF